MYAFDLLATVAGKLLVGKDNSPSSINLPTKQDQVAIIGGNANEACQDSQEQLELQLYDQAAGKLHCLCSKLVTNRDCDPDDYFKEANRATMGFADIKASSDGSAGLDSDKLGKNEIGYLAEKTAVDSSEYLKSSNYKPEDEIKRKNVVELFECSNAPQDNGTGIYCLGDQVVWDAKPLVQISSDSNARMSFKEEESAPCNIFSQDRDNIALDSKDDDENSSGCTHCSNLNKSFSPAPCMGDRRIRKVLASKYHKVATKWKDKLFPRHGMTTKQDSGATAPVLGCMILANSMALIAISYLQMWI